jgi:hypothetical protein
MSTTAKSKTLATWLAVIGGTLGAHRFYLHGLKDPMAWLHPLPTLVGLAGVIRMQNLGQDDTVSWLLIPILGAMISVAMFSAILIGLTNDERWAQRFGAGQDPKPTGWGPVIGVVVALFFGAGTLMGSIAFGGQKYFEWQQEKAAAKTATLDPKP